VCACVTSKDYVWGGNGRTGGGEKFMGVGGGPAEIVCTCGSVCVCVSAINL